MKNTKSIYLVDDSEDDIMLIRKALQSVITDVEITEISDGQHLLDLISVKKFDSPALILMDMCMPRVGGIEAVSSLKSNPDTTHIPVVMLSTCSDPRLIQGAYEEGISAFITKPVEPNEYKIMAEAINVCFLNSYVCNEMIDVTASFKDKSILVIEDNKEHSELMSFAFKRHIPNLKIIYKNSKTETLNFLTDSWFDLPSPPDLIILDLYLPNRQDGLSLLNSIRYFFLFHGLPAIPVIILSASDHIEDIKACYRHSANAYIVKSVDFSESISYFKSLFHFWCNTISVPKAV